jgi:hypothetical protein
MAVETTFTLIAWIMVGQRFEEVRLPHLYPIQCTVFRDEMLRERSPVRAVCVPEPLPRAIMPVDEPLPLCAHGGGSCAWPLLPGRRRV